MPYIIGTSIPEEKVLVQSMCDIYGLGLSQSKNLCKKAGFGSDARGSDVTFLKGKVLENFAEATLLPFGADLRRFQNDRIYHLCNISTYRGSRHRKGLPVRGQRTHTNAKKRPLLKFNVK
uniref:Ribosomal protein S13 n=1 Tax=Pleurocladia lacustris TaxID=246121 RepID=A0A1I9LW64_9PHAE|nr:ribosomal protein S13 [Pleurocladia lacustris]ANS57834.1 ribosomal protein S13 [Pleurocladia lacustris]ANS57876.1 ribosomal protein S13 [Pleurocladia lacustris]